MTISVTTLANAADGLLETALLGNDWREPLSGFAAAAGAKGATLVRNEPSPRFQYLLHDEFVLATDSIAEHVADYLTGLAPPDPRTRRVSPKFGQGFVTDYDQFSQEEINRSAFYEEFLRPRHLRWHACGLIDRSRIHGRLFLSLKRSIEQDHYTHGEIQTINEVLPKIQMAASISRAILRAENRGIGKTLGQRGEAVIELDNRGRILGFNDAANSLIDCVVGTPGGYLTAPLAEDAHRLQKAIAAPLRDPPRVACILLNTAVPGRRIVLRTMPVVGVAHDIFAAAAALAVVSVWEKPARPPKKLLTTLCEAFDLTAAEARVAALIGLGLSPADAAGILTISTGTARNYFKAAQSKIGVSRQAELASLVALLQA